MTDQQQTEERDLSGKFTVADYDGIAWYCLGYVMTRDEDYEWSGIENEDRSRVRMVMVGDDRVFEIDVDDLTPIAEEDFCPGCGQVGCGAYA